MINNFLTSNQGQNFLIIVLGLIILSVINGVLQKIKIRKFLRNSLKTNAMIAEAYYPKMLRKIFADDKSAKSANYSIYIVGFLDYNGKECISKVKSIKRFKQNDEVEIFYLKKDSSQVKFNCWSDLKYAPFMFLYFFPSLILLTSIMFKLA